MKRFKNLLLLTGLLAISAKGYNQFLPSVIAEVQMNQCYTPDTTGINGYSLDSVRVIVAPTHGTLDTIPGPFTYCPDSNFVGTDTVQIFACSPIFGIFSCGTFTVVFNVSCNLNIDLVEDSNAICIGGNRHYTAYPRNGTPPFTYLWNDGSVLDNACGTAPAVPICVTVTDANGCQGQTCAGQNGCQLYVTFVSNICGGPLPSVQAVATGGTPPYTYYWSTGDSSTTLCNLQQGTYCLSVFDVYGCSGAGCSNIGGCQLACSINYSTSMCATSLMAGVQNGTPPFTYLWSNGDTAQFICNPQSTTYCLTVTDALGCTGSTCYNTACQLNLSITTNPFCGGPVSNVSGGTPPYTYLWSNGDTSELLCNLPSGNYCLTVTDALSCTIAGCFTMPGPNACFFNYYLYPPTGAVTFYPSFDSSQTIVSQTWDFGDGSTYTVQGGGSPGHGYASTGYYYVCMNVLYSSGDTCSFCDYVYVLPDSNNYGCQAYFYNYIDSANTNTFHFVDYSVYSALSWDWDFGDGNTSTIQNPAHTYSSQGTWNVCLTITDSRGCSSNYCNQLSNIPVQDLEAYLYHQTTVTPGFPVWAYLSYYNSGTILMSGTVQYRYPAGTTLHASSVTPLAHDVVNRLLTFNFTNLLPGTSDYIMIDLDASSTLVLGSLAEDTMWVNPVNGDITPANNVSFIEDSVVGSWDPNDKAVSPKGEGDNGIVPLNTTELSYRIRFQNTGNAAAQTVAIHDVISNNIDLTTVKVTDASHEHSTEIVGNELIVTFGNINLPDSGSNYLASQGFINIRATLKPGLTAGTRILNTADIYFDFNTPVITNTVVTTLGNVISGFGPDNNFDFTVLPNPASSQISIRGEFEKGASYGLMNQLGQVVLEGNVNSSNTVVNLTGLSDGIYLLKVRSGDRTGVRKLVLSK